MSTGPITPTAGTIPSTAGATTRAAGPITPIARGKPLALDGRT
ncbi:MAG TPA: hypothetical protein PKK06_00925 [Phycisphaerae bacterium]|nr:hypothetical protein [Phycisphaerae bacterium]HNU43828.1 hypothetical protein [Phycisphaerae bacterium]